MSVPSRHAGKALALDPIKPLSQVEVDVALAVDAACRLLRFFYLALVASVAM